MDAIDVALVDIDTEVERGRIELREFVEIPYPAELRARLERVVQLRAAAIDEIGALHTALGQTFAEAALSLLSRAKETAAAVRALGSHGQTIGHGIAGATPYTWQIGDPHVIALRTGICTVADFRAMDVAAGGQGAPLVPGFHRRVFHKDDADVAVVNIGGLSNVSLLRRDPRTPLLGFDCGPGNTLMDLWAQKHLGRPYDADGQWAATGRAHAGLLRQMLSEPYFTLPPPKSTGRELFHLAWLEQHLAACDASLLPEDVQATLAALTVKTIVDAIEQHLPACREIVVCGGGARNGTLLSLLAAAAGESRSVTTSDARGWPAAAIEACTFAWLAARRLAGLPGNVPSVTGAAAPVLLGAVYESGNF
ncbi:MAG: anhydro-N-acetylmuramic acid kinase [Gammaproteobacteria bacterium]